MHIKHTWMRVVESRSLSDGSVLMYSWAVVSPSFFSTSFAPRPIHTNTSENVSSIITSSSTRSYSVYQGGIKQFVNNLLRLASCLYCLHLGQNQRSLRHWIVQRRWSTGIVLVGMWGQLPATICLSHTQPCLPVHPRTPAAPFPPSL